jgi:endo-1,4-beta-D-glucanase Y
MRTYGTSRWLLLPLALTATHCSDGGKTSTEPTTTATASSPSQTSSGSTQTSTQASTPTSQPTGPVSPSATTATTAVNPASTVTISPTSTVATSSNDSAPSSSTSTSTASTNSGMDTGLSSGTSAPPETSDTSTAPSTDTQSSAGTGSELGFIEQPDDPCAARAGYRNLFAELLSKSQAEVDAKIDDAFQSLFYGDGTNIYYETGADEAYILDVNNNDVRSEGMSYGMIISVQLDKKEEFDKLWRWARNRMYVTSGQLAGYFNWQMSSSGQVIGGPSAPDGEEYFAMALVLASERWGDGEGILNYGQQARTLLADLTTKGAFNRDSHLVTFGPTCCYDYTDPSYVLPAFYEKWACFDQQTRGFWQSAVTAARQHLRAAPHSETGLAPYLANFDGSPHPSGPDFNTDSWRVVGNIMMDYHLYDHDPWHTEFADRFADFFISQEGKQPIPAEFRLNGEVTVTYDGPAKGLVSQNALVAFGATPEKGRGFVQALWDTPIPFNEYRYYDGVLYMLALLHAGGRFRVDF